MAEQERVTTCERCLARPVACVDNDGCGYMGCPNCRIVGESRPRRSAEVQRALDDCRQAIADVHAGPLTAEQHGRMRRKVAKLEAELAAAHACIEAADIVRDVCRDQSTLCDGRFEMALSHYDIARAEYERVTKEEGER